MKRIGTSFNILPVFPKAGPRLKELKVKTGVLASMRKSLSAKFTTSIFPGVRSDRHLEIKYSYVGTIVNCGKKYPVTFSLKVRATLLALHLNYYFLFFCYQVMGRAILNFTCDKTVQSSAYWWLCIFSKRLCFDFCTGNPEETANITATEYNDWNNFISNVKQSHKPKNTK